LSSFTDVASTLIEIAHTLDSTLDEEGRITRSLELLCKLLKCDRCGTLFEIDDRPKLLLTAPADAGDTAAWESRLTALLGAVRDGAPMPPPDGLQEQALPLVGLDEVRGIIAVERRPAPLDDREMRILSVIAAQLGAYLTTLRLHRRAVALDRFRQEMSGLVAHDIKNPLNAVLGTVDYMLAELADRAPDVATGLTDIRLACQRILRLTADLMDVSRLESHGLVLRLVPIKLSDTLLALARQRNAQARARDVRFRLDDIPSDIRVLADENLFSRIIDNLLDNALRYTPRGGLIDLRAATTGDRVQLRVGNTGPPIPTQAQNRLFKKYGRAAEPGSGMNPGLGLYFSRMAIEAQGGAIWVEQTEELPTIFVLELPAAPAGQS
jgi:signal transduction histidine kinase